jgi:cytochrome c-type biogenesis protein CcmH
MIAFWAAAGLISAATAILILYRAGGAAGRAPTDVSRLFYSRQLAELADLADRGLLGEGERKSAEAEAGRRLLAAADTSAEAWSTDGYRNAVLVAAIAASALAVALYLFLGARGYPDQPFAKRLDAWSRANPESLSAPELAALVSQKVREHPDDPEGYRFLALADGASGDATGAVQALKRGLRVAPQRADLWAMLGEALAFENGGQVTPEAQDAFRQVLKLDPANVTARFELARAQVSNGDRAGGLAGYRAVLAALPPGDERAGTVQAAIAEAEGTPAPPPAAPQGLSGDQLTAVKGMVQGLAERLKSSPDDPEGWVRLVRAYAVLGDNAQRDAALKSASQRYAAKPDILAQLREAAAAAPMK